MKIASARKRRGDGEWRERERKRYGRRHDTGTDTSRAVPGIIQGCSRMVREGKHGCRRELREDLVPKKSRVDEKESVGIREEDSVNGGRKGFVEEEFHETADIGVTEVLRIRVEGGRYRRESAERRDATIEEQRRENSLNRPHLSLSIYTSSKFVFCSNVEDNLDVVSWSMDESESEIETRARKEGEGERARRRNSRRERDLSLPSL